MQHMLSFGTPTGVIATYRVAVLIENLWRSLSMALEADCTGVEECEPLDLLDTLVTAVAPALAVQAVYAHIPNYACIYRQFGIHTLAFRQLTPRQQELTTIWSDLFRRDMARKVQTAIEVAVAAG